MIFTTLVLISGFSAYGILSYAMFTEYLTTLPYCSHSNEKGQCIPCPQNAKCLETEIQCDERYSYQNGQCLPVHLTENQEDAEILRSFQIENQFPKQIFLFSIEAIASISLIVFVIVQIHQIKRSKPHSK